MNTPACSHSEATLHPVGEGFRKTCSCGMEGTGRDTKEAWTSFLLARMQAGERLNPSDEALVAFTPAPFGTAPSCHHRGADHVRSFLLGGT